MTLREKRASRRRDGNVLIPFGSFWIYHVPNDRDHDSSNHARINFFLNMWYFATYTKLGSSALNEIVLNKIQKIACNMKIAHPLGFAQQQRSVRWVSRKRHRTLALGDFSPRKHVSKLCLPSTKVHNWYRREENLRNAISFFHTAFSEKVFVEAELYPFLSPVSSICIIIIKRCAQIIRFNCLHTNNAPDSQRINEFNICTVFRGHLEYGSKNEGKNVMVSIPIWHTEQRDLQMDRDLQAWMNRRYRLIEREVTATPACETEHSTRVLSDSSLNAESFVWRNRPSRDHVYVHVRENSRMRFPGQRGFPENTAPLIFQYFPAFTLSPGNYWQRQSRLATFHDNLW